MHASLIVIPYWPNLNPYNGSSSAPLITKLPKYLIGFWGCLSWCRTGRLSWCWSGYFLGVFLCVDLSSAVGVLVTSSQIGPFNAPCYRPNIPTCDFAQNTSQKHPRRNNTNQKRHWLQPLWAHHISNRPDGEVKFARSRSVWFQSPTGLAPACRSEAGLRPTVEAHRCRYYHLLSVCQVHANLLLLKYPLS